ncbi:metallophosphoesterase [Candidatus Sumerlaeota bacterium]|nr:metallophosphoesterase [Candidatus Sumerlaeota bacterium]
MYNYGKNDRPLILSVLVSMFIFTIHPLYPIEKGDGTSFTFVQLCDPQLGMGGYEHDMETFAKAVQRINILKPDFVIICGDLVNIANVKSCGDFEKIKSDLKVPCYLLAGNHDIGNEPTSATLTFYRKTFGKDYYSFQHKRFAFIVVNTQLWKSHTKGESERHDLWFRKELRAASERKSPVIVAGHYPLFLKSPDEKEEYFNISKEKRLEILSLFKECGVIAMLGGHVHKLIINDYEGIQFVNGETTCVNFDKRPFGFRLWRVDASGALTHEFIPLEEDKIE